MEPIAAQIDRLAGAPLPIDDVASAREAAAGLILVLDAAAATFARFMETVASVLGQHPAAGELTASANEARMLCMLTVEHAGHIRDNVNTIATLGAQTEQTREVVISTLML